MAKQSEVSDDIHSTEDGLGDLQFEYNVRHSEPKTHTFVAPARTTDVKAIDQRPSNTSPAQSCR
jgi:hypothetical protein